MDVQVRVARYVDARIPVTLVNPAGARVAGLTAADVLCRIRDTNGVWMTVNLAGVGADFVEEDAGSIAGEYAAVIPGDLLFDMPGLWRGYLAPVVPGTFVETTFLIDVTAAGTQYESVSAVNSLHGARTLLKNFDNDVMVFLGMGWDDITYPYEVPICQYMKRTDTSWQTLTLLPGTNWETMGDKGWYRLSLTAAQMSAAGPFLLRFLEPVGADEIVLLTYEVALIKFDQIADGNLKFEHVYAVADISARNCLEGKLSHTIITAKLDWEADFSNGEEIARIYYHYDEMSVDGKVIRVDQSTT